MSFDPFTLVIMDIFGKKYNVFCLGNDHTIEYIKFILSEKTGIDREEITLIMGSTKLQGYSKFKDYSIHKDSRIRMLVSMKSGLNYF